MSQNPTVLGINADGNQQQMLPSALAAPAPLTSAEPYPVLSLQFQVTASGAEVDSRIMARAYRVVGVLVTKTGGTGGAGDGFTFQVGAGAAQTVDLNTVTAGVVTLVPTLATATADVAAQESIVVTGLNGALTSACDVTFLLVGA